MLVMLSAIALLAGPTADDLVSTWASIPSHYSSEARDALVEYALSGNFDRQEAIVDDQIKNARKAAPKSGLARRAAFEQIKQLELRRRLIKAKVVFPQPGFFSKDTLSKGAVGVFEQKLRVIQVISGTVRCQFSPGVEILLLDEPADSIADGDVLDLFHVFECVGTRTYKTVAGGTATLYAFRRFPYKAELEEWEQLRIHSYAEWATK